VLDALAQPVINHRGPEFAAILHRVTVRLQYFFQTASPVLTFPASGTAGMECALLNLFSPGEHVVALSTGAYGSRFAQIAEAYGLQVTRITFPWGMAADPDAVEAHLQGLAPYRAVLLVQNETSTGVTNDIQTLATLIRWHNPDALIVVDAMSSLGCMPLDMDLWDIDVVFTASQNGWMCPPGLMMLAAGPRAWEANTRATLPRFSCDWAMARLYLEMGQHPVTPPVSLFYALDRALEMMLAEGREHIFERHQAMGRYVRRWIEGMGLELLADHAYASDTVTAFLVPDGIDGRVLLDTLREERRGLEHELTGTRERLGRIDVEEAEGRLRLDTTVEGLRTEFDVEPHVALDAPAPTVPDGTTFAGRARELERDLRLMGPINPLALDEHRALQERHEFLQSQLDDVRGSRRELTRVLRAVDKEIVSVFEEAFADVARHFGVLFSTLFPGGAGRLSLLDPDDLLDTGIEIDARPSGKNVRRLSLLSGGERSLTALAYLFAVFRARPSPFYLLDEVEAALDDVNLHRFLDLVHEFRNEAQLVIVTHQKRTMEAGDVLYGVTMPPGGSTRVVSQRVADSVGA
jgi:aspartate aminotransferase-like enzyme